MSADRLKQLEQSGVFLTADARLMATLAVEPPVYLADVQALSPTRIGRHTYLYWGAKLGAVKSIGRYCAIASNVSMGEGHHPMDWLSIHPFQYGSSFFSYWPGHKELTHVRPLPAKIAQKTPTVIGNDVWIGSGAIILKGVTVGDGAIIGGGAMVKHDVKPYEIVGGTPAKHIRFRFPPDIIEQLMELRWWQYTRESLDGVPFDDIHAAIKELKRRHAAGLLQVDNTDTVNIGG